MGMKLFDDGDDKKNDDISKIEINKEYARRFEYNKKREDLHRYQELKNKGVIVSSESNSEESSFEDGEDDFDLKDSSNQDLEFFDALIKVRNQDPLLKQKDVKLFDTDDNSEKEEVELGDKGGKGKKAMYLKDVMAKHLIEEGPEFEESEVMVKGGKKSYNEEQDEIRKAFLDAAKEVEDDDGGDFLKLKEKKREDVAEDGDVDDFAKKVDEYFVREGELDENSLFLRDFFRKRMWEDKDRNKMDVFDEEMDDVLRDKEEIERQEEYEQGYNFRYEENAGDRVMSYSRRVEGSVRKKDNARKEQRRSKEERMRIAEMERKEELKHLKNLKKKEMEERMRKVLEAAGIRENGKYMLDLDDLEEDFDPEEYDKKMKTAFDEKYYGDEDVDPHFGSGKDEDGAEIEKPDFDKEDELLGLPKGWDAPESRDGFLATRERILKRKAENDGEEDDSEEESEEGEEDEEEGEEDEREGEEESMPKRKRKMSLMKKVKEEMLEEYYKLDYEDTVGDLKTRFKYAKVNPNRYGLKTEEILMLDDNELNQYVSLKKITPYQENEWKIPYGKRREQKMKIKELVGGKKLDGGKAGRKKDNKKASKKQRSKNEADTANSVVISTKDEKDKVQELNGDVSKLSRKARRKRNQAGLKLSHSRLIAYGKIQPKPKHKQKH